MNVAFVTGSRADWRLVQPLLVAARADDTFTPRLLVTGAHLSPRHGKTVRAIRAAGYEPDACIPILEDTDSDLAVARATGRAVLGFSDALAGIRPDWTVIVGDRYESFAAGVAATMLGIPLAHIAGGETDVATNQDCNLRNALTKLAQVHFVAHELAATRVTAMGEEPWRVHVVGLPSLDGIVASAADFETLRCIAGMPSDCVARDAHAAPDARRFILVSFLPVTLESAAALSHLEHLLAALDEQPQIHKLVVLSNADADGDVLDGRIRRWSAGRADVTLAAALAPNVYSAALRDAACYVGNSSSGVIEAPAFGTPSIIVGTRQDGRPTAACTEVLRTPTSATLARALRDQIDHGTYRDVSSPYGDGDAALRVCNLLRTLRDDPRLLTKRLVVPSRANDPDIECTAHSATRGDRRPGAKRGRKSASGAAQRRTPHGPPAETAR